MSFYKKYIMLNLNEYDSFEGFDFYVTLFIAILTVFICIGICISNTRKNTMLTMVKQLYRHGATSEESAKSLKELRIKNTFFLRSLLSDGTRLSRIVLRVGAKKLTYEEYIEEMKSNGFFKRKKRKEANACDSVSDEKIDFESAKFYISDEKELEVKNILSKNVTTPWQNVLLCVFFVCISICIVFLMPEILHFVDYLLSKN